jgi:hypothetical protein
MTASGTNAKYQLRPSGACVKVASLPATPIPAAPLSRTSIQREAISRILQMSWWALLRMVVCAS